MNLLTSVAISINFTNTYYLADNLKSFDPVQRTGVLEYKRYENSTRLAFNNMMGVLKPVNANEFPGNEYEAAPNLPFSIDFVSARTIRIRTATGFQKKADESSLMLVNGTAPSDQTSWKFSKTADGYLYTSEFGSVLIRSNPWSVELRDKNGYFLTRTVHLNDLANSSYIPQLPFSYVRRASDYSRSINAAFYSVA